MDYPKSPIGDVLSCLCLLSLSLIPGKQRDFPKAQPSQTLIVSLTTFTNVHQRVALNHRSPYSHKEMAQCYHLVNIRKSCQRDCLLPNGGSSVSLGLAPGMRNVITINITYSYRISPGLVAICLLGLAEKSLFLITFPHLYGFLLGYVRALIYNFVMPCHVLCQHAASPIDLSVELAHTICVFF